MSRKNSFMFTNKSHSDKGIMATILGVISLVTLIYTLVMSYRNNGNIPRQYGAAALLVTIFAFVGAGLGMVSKTERDKFFLLSGDFFECAGAACCERYFVCGGIRDRRMMPP